MQDNHSTVVVARSISPLTQTNDSTAIVGEIVDHAGYDSAEYIIQYGAMTDADMTLVTLLEEGDTATLTDNTAVADADMQGTEAGATPLFSNDNKNFKLGYTGTKRYTRLTITPTNNNSGDLPVAAVCVLGRARLDPHATQMS